MNRRQQEELIQSAFDHTLTETEFDQFEEQLRSDPGLRALYYEYCRLDHSLTEEFETRSFVPARLRALATNEQPQRRSMVQALLSAAAILVVLLSAAYFVALKPPVPSTAVIFGPESNGQIVHTEGGASRTELRPGSRFTLNHGSVELTLPSGVLAIIEGPAKLESLGDNEVRLDQGRAWFRVPPGAEGFTCQTPSLQVVDLGTEFGVIANGAVGEEVHVFKGRVRVTPNGQANEVRNLHAGESLLWNGTALQALTDARPFVTSLPRYDTIFKETFSGADDTPLANKSPDIGAGPWEVVTGTPVITDGILDTSGHSKVSFAPLDCKLDELNHILLLTIRTENPDTHLFHTEGWAGISLFTGAKERIFVGDPGGSSTGWAIHPAGGSVVSATPPLAGKQTVTLRYDFRSGHAELFEGADTNRQPVASEWIAPGLAFDRLRISNAMGGDIALDDLQISRLHSPVVED